MHAWERGLQPRGRVCVRTAPCAGTIPPRGSSPRVPAPSSLPRWSRSHAVQPAGPSTRGREQHQHAGLSRSPVSPQNKQQPTPGPRGTAALRDGAGSGGSRRPAGAGWGARGPAAPCSPPCPHHGHLHGADDAGGMPVGCRGWARGLAASRRPPAPLLGPRHPPPGPIVLPRRAAGQDSFVRAEQYFILTINQTRPGSRACL